MIKGVKCRFFSKMLKNSFWNRKLKALDYAVNDSLLIPVLFVLK